MIAIPDLYEKFLECSSVSTDTRQITPDCLFVALKGPSFNANQFAHEALAKGARYVIVDEPAVAHQDGRCLLVEDGLTALQELARYHRQTLTIPVIGLTGSNGKTTTKELIASVLSRKYALYATRGNLNNHIGVPLTVLALRGDGPNEQHELAVVEMGANHQQEIALLCSICQPTHGLITNVGKAHLEGFGGIEGVRKGKGELYDYLAASEGTVFVNASDPNLMDMYRERKGFGKSVFYLDENSHELLQESPVAIYRTAKGQQITTHLPGRYNFLNMAAALAIGNHFGVSPDEANHAIADYNPTNNRSQIVAKGTNTILLDAYNANPSSMTATLLQFMKQPAERKMLILGDMYELGDESPAEHAALGQLIAQGRFDVVILAGKDMKFALESLPQAYYFPDKFSLHNWIADNPMQHTHILIKGSRGMGLESVVPFI